MVFNSFNTLKVYMSRINFTKRTVTNSCLSCSYNFVLGLLVYYQDYILVVVNAKF